MNVHIKMKFSLHQKITGVKNNIFIVTKTDNFPEYFKNTGQISNISHTHILIHTYFDFNIN